MPLREDLTDFVAWWREHVSGDEKGESQIFLDHLFEALGHRGGCRAAGGTLEERVYGGRGKAVKFADFVWKPVVLIEMKRRGTDLRRHYEQAFHYWTRLVPNRPRYVVLCNFDQLWIYDFESQVDEPIDVLNIEDLPARPGPLLFLLPKPETPVFGNDQEAVTREAADLLATCFRSLRTRVGQPMAQRFTLQMLVALFAEDIGLLEQYFVTRLLEECKRPQDTYDLLGNLFAAMADRGRTPGGRYRGVDYFNGGLFAEPARVELIQDELDLLRNAASKQWSQVRPEIFGTIFEHSLETEERHAQGAHYTSQIDILKIVGPTIVEPWRDAIESASSQRSLMQLLTRLSNFTVLDPACGSGNFLYIAYREIKRLESRIFERLNELSERDLTVQRPLRLVTARNFYGMDVNPFAIELAKVTMSIARKLAVDELHSNENALPLDNLDENFVVADALMTPAGERTAWPPVDVIIGNPPFLGAKLLKPKLGVDYVKRLRRLYPEVPGMADYCVYWLRRANDHLVPPSTEDRFQGRAGLVGTQNIRNNESRVGGLDHIARAGTIIDAVENQPWSGEANVNVSIVNWLKTQDESLMKGPRKLWSKLEPAAGTKKGRGNSGKRYELAVREVDRINSALSDQTDVSGAGALECNTSPQRCFNGQMLGHAAFLLSSAERDQLVRRDPRSSEVIHPYLNGLDALTGVELDKYVLDFGQMDQLQAAGYPAAFEWVRSNVLPDRQRKAEEGKDENDKARPHHKGFLARWWQLSFGRPEMLSVITPLPRYLACSYVTKRPIFVFISSSIRPSNLIQVFGFDDDYSFGILQSALHWRWFVTKCGKLTERFRYSGESVFDTFPWPQHVTAGQANAVAEAGREIRRVRARALGRGGLRALYRTLDLPGQNPLRDAHSVLDAAVLKAYGFSTRDEPLLALLELNRDVAARTSRGEEVNSPGLPATLSAVGMVSDDAIGVVTDE